MNIKPDIQPIAIKANEVSSHNNRQFVPEPYVEVAQGMEKQFVEFMLQEMNKTTGHSDNSAGMDYYRNLLTTEHAQQLIEQGNGLGLQDVILDQIYPQNMRSEIAYNHYKNQQEALMRSRPSVIRMQESEPTQQDIQAAIERATKNMGVKNHE